MHDYYWHSFLGSAPCCSRNRYTPRVDAADALQVRSVSDVPSRKLSRIILCVIRFCLRDEPTSCRPSLSGIHPIWYACGLNAPSALSALLSVLRIVTKSSARTGAPQRRHAIAMGRAYLRATIAEAAAAGRPVVLEEFGFPRDGGSLSPAAPTSGRDAFFAMARPPALSPGTVPALYR